MCWGGIAGSFKIERSRMASVKCQERLNMLSRDMEKNIYIVYKIIKTLELL